jgi:hypothetical protein
MPESIKSFDLNSLEINNLRLMRLWNTDFIKLRLDEPWLALSRTDAGAGMIRDLKLFTSYSQGCSFLPAVRRETNFRFPTQQENLPRLTDIYF